MRRSWFIFNLLWIMEMPVPPILGQFESFGICSATRDFDHSEMAWNRTAMVDGVF